MVIVTSWVAGQWLLLYHGELVNGYCYTMVSWSMVIDRAVMISRSIESRPRLTTKTQLSPTIKCVKALFDQVTDDKQTFKVYIAIMVVFSEDS